MYSFQHSTCYTEKCLFRELKCCFLFPLAALCWSCSKSGLRSHFLHGSRHWRWFNTQLSTSGGLGYWVERQCCLNFIIPTRQIQNAVHNWLGSLPRLTSFLCHYGSCEGCGIQLQCRRRQLAIPRLGFWCWWTPGVREVMTWGLAEVIGCRVGHCF